MGNTQSMKFLVNNKEYSEFLARHMLMRRVKVADVGMPRWKKANKVANELRQLLNPIPGLELTPKDSNGKEILKKYIQDAVEQELNKWQDQTLTTALGSQKFLRNFLNQQFRSLTHEYQLQIHKEFEKSSIATLTKQLISAYADQATLYPRDWVDNNDPESLFIRNTVNNEALLKYRMDNDLPFVFMDSGYTNFLESGKKWHRLCKNHMHHIMPPRRGPDHKRTKIFPCLPQPWRTGGSKIIIVEPSSIQCTLFEIDIEHWRGWVSDRLNQNLQSSKEIIFREKTDKKIRQNFYQYLLEDDDVYCVVHFNSNAGVEAIWAGVPVLTLGNHITRSVSSTEWYQINNLERPDLDRWLGQLASSQYTIEEIVNGTAKHLMETRCYV